MKPLLLLTLFHISWRLFAQAPDSVQVDIVDVVIGQKRLQKTNEVRAERKVYFSLLPAAVSVPGGGRAVITAINAAFYLGDPTLTNLSNVYIIPYTNLADRYGIYLRPNIWLSKNSFNLPGDYRIAHFPQYSWGMGGNSPEWDESLIDSDFLRAYQTILKKVYKNWYAGPGYALDYRYNIEETEYEGEGHLSRYGEGSLTSTVSSGFTFNVVYDARINAINPPAGAAYLLLSYRWNAESLGSTYDNHSFFADFRKYFRLQKTGRHLLAVRSYYWTVIEGKTPYLDLPSTNWAPASGFGSRGFQIGRYRSNAMLYGEAEQRFTLTKNGLLGFVAFANLSSASDYGTQHFRHWQMGAGIGARVKFNKYSDTNLAVDLGFSRNYWGVWLNIGEMF